MLNEILLIWVLLLIGKDRNLLSWAVIVGQFKQISCHRITITSALFVFHIYNAAYLQQTAFSCDFIVQLCRHVITDNSRLLFILYKLLLLLPQG